MTLVYKSTAGPCTEGQLAASSDDENGDFSTCSESWEEAWSVDNQQKLTQISRNFCRPRSLTIPLVIVISLVRVAFYPPDDSDWHANVSIGGYVSCFIFFSISVELFVFSNRLYNRPYPIAWQFVFGMSVIYLLFLSFIFFQSYSDVKILLKLIDHNLDGSASDGLIIYNDNCSVSWTNVYRRVDIFVPAHFIGWMFKAIVVRHAVVVWSLSIMWEVTELFFAHVLPNFNECWWDILIFDILLSNGLGIYVGMVLCKKLKVRNFYWQSIRDIKGTEGKLKRNIIPFSLQDWSKDWWLDHSSTQMRILAIFVLILLFLITELNGFLLKQIFFIPTDHFLTIGRLFFVFLIAVPAVHQYYLYTTDKTYKRLGTQCWIYVAIIIMELLISIRFGAPILPSPALSAVVAWVVVVALLSFVTVFLITDTQVKRDLFGWFWWLVTTVVPVSTTRKTVEKILTGNKKKGAEKKKTQPSISL